MKIKRILFLTVIIIVTLLIGSILLSKRDKEISTNNNQHDNPIYIPDEFSINLIKAVNKSNEKNYLVSPYSIEIALSMLKDGADGNTLAEIEKVIGTTNINNINVKDRIGLANGAFIRNKYKNDISKEYYDTLKNKYQAEIIFDEFQTPKKINDWVKQKTYGMIEKVIDDISDKDNAEFALGLANAIAIDVKWNSPFECINTVSQKFNKTNGEVMNTEMMHQTLEYDGKYLHTDSAEGVIIPYKSYNQKTGEEDYNGIALEYVAILPSGNIYEYINNLTNEELEKLDNSQRKVDDTFEIALSLPRYSYQYELINFKEILKDLGIKDAFDSNNANFNKIMKDLYIEDAIHKTYIDLNEKGTKAAAVTYFGMFKSTAMRDEKEKIEITFDKPFIYMIRDSKTKEILFFGTVYEPNKWSGKTCSETEKD